MNKDYNIVGDKNYGKWKCSHLLEKCINILNTDWISLYWVNGMSIPVCKGLTGCLYGTKE